MNEAIAQALTVWRKASAEHERLDTPRTYAVEQTAWDAYAQLCDEDGRSRRKRGD